MEHNNKSASQVFGNGWDYEASEALLLIMLVTFYKHKALPSKCVSDLCSKGFLMPYMMEKDENLKDRVFVKLTYKGRKKAQDGNKALNRIPDDDGVTTRDIYANEQTSGDRKFMMHHKRYLQELNAGNEARLISLYASSFSDVDFY